MSGGREARLGLMLIVLAVVAVILVTTSPRSAPGEDRSSDATASTPNQSPLQPSPSQSPTETEAIPGAARKVAARWAAAYTTSDGAESWAARLARLRPYSTRSLIAEMRINSGALELERDARTIGEVAAVQTQDSTDPGVVMVLVDKTTVTKGRRATELTSVTLRLVSSRDRWRVAEVLVP